MTPARALSASCPTCGDLRIMLPIGQEPSGSHVRCPFCRRFMLEWRWIEGKAHTTYQLPYPERLGMTIAGPQPKQTQVEDV